MKTRSAFSVSSLVARVSGLGRGRLAHNRNFTQAPSFPRTLVRYALFALLTAALVLPLFAHGCHGDDVDHEPLVFPVRFNGDR